MVHTSTMLPCKQLPNRQPLAGLPAPFFFLQHRAHNGSRNSAVASVLRRRAVASTASAHGLPAPFQLRGVARRPATGAFRDAADDAMLLHRGSMPYPPHMAAGNKAVFGGTQVCRYIATLPQGDEQGTDYQGMCLSVTLLVLSSASYARYAGSPDT